MSKRMRHVKMESQEVGQSIRSSWNVSSTIGGMSMMEKVSHTMEDDGNWMA